MSYYVRQFMAELRDLYESELPARLATLGAAASITMPTVADWLVTSDEKVSGNLPSVRFAVEGDVNDDPNETSSYGDVTIPVAIYAYQGQGTATGWDQRELADAAAWVFAEAMRQQLMQRVKCARVIEEVLLVSEVKTSVEPWSESDRHKRVSILRAEITLRVTWRG